VAAVNRHGRLEVEGVEARDETPLEAAIRLQRPELVAVLLEAGAVADGLFGGQHGRATALLLCIAYGLEDAMRRLLFEGHDAKSPVVLDAYMRLEEPYVVHPWSLVPLSAAVAWPPVRRDAAARARVPAGARGGGVGRRQRGAR
jgi:hypothetical protein